MAKEKRLIDANAVVEKLTNFAPNGWGKDVPYIRSQWAMAVKVKDNFLKAIAEAPTVDAVEVVHSYWDYERIDAICNHCGFRWFAWCQECAVCPSDVNYCPNCGAKMDGGNEDGC